MGEFEEFKQKTERAKDVWRSKYEVFKSEFDSYKKLRETGVLKDDTKELFEFRNKLDKLIEETEKAKKKNICYYANSSGCWLFKRIDLYFDKHSKIFFKRQLGRGDTAFWFSHENVLL